MSLVEKKIENSLLILSKCCKFVTITRNIIRPVEKKQKRLINHYIILLNELFKI